mgnify:CR=1 FL=1
MNKKETLLLIGTIVLGLGAVGTILGLKKFSGTRSKASQENQPKNIRLEEVNPTSATISWTTKEPAYGFVSYGESMSLGNTVQTGEKATVHTATVPNLTAGTTYYYKVGVGEEIYDNEGVPYSFTTPKDTTTKKEPAEETATSAFQEETEQESQEQEATDSAKTEEDFKNAFGTENAEFDLNGDGKVTVLDLLMFRKQQGE